MIKKTPRRSGNTVKAVAVIIISTTEVTITQRVRHLCCTAVVAVSTSSVANINSVVATTISNTIWTWFWTKNRRHQYRRHRRRLQCSLLQRITITICCNFNTTIIKN